MLTSINFGTGPRPSLPSTSPSGTSKTVDVWSARARAAYLPVPAPSTAPSPHPSTTLTLFDARAGARLLLSPSTPPLGTLLTNTIEGRQRPVGTGEGDLPVRTVYIIRQSNSGAEKTMAKRGEKRGATGAMTDPPATGDGDEGEGGRRRNGTCPSGTEPWRTKPMRRSATPLAGRRQRRRRRRHPVAAPSTRRPSSSAR